MYEFLLNTNKISPNIFPEIGSQTDNWGPGTRIEGKHKIEDAPSVKRPPDRLELGDDSTDRQF